MTTIVVAAVARNGVIGRDGDLAWRDRDDLQRLKSMTMGHTLVMGRRNYESIGRPLPGRRTVVATRRRDWSAPGVTVVHDLGESLSTALDEIVRRTGDEVVFLFGGGEIYRQLMDTADRLEITEIAQDLPGDVFFPEIDPLVWIETAREQRDGYDWVRYDRRDRAERSA